MEQKFSLTLTPEEYRQVLKRRIETCLRDAAIPEDVVSDVMAAFTRSDGAAAAPTVTPRAAIVAPRSGSRVDQRQKAHWPAPGVKPIAQPSTTQDAVLNAMFKGCRTVPELTKATHKPRKAVYTALWALKKNGVIDQGEPPAE